MRLTYSKSSEISLYDHWQRFCAMQMQSPEDVVRHQPQIARQLLQGGDRLCTENIPQHIWKQIVKDFFLSKLTGFHRELNGIFKSLTEENYQPCLIGSYTITAVLGAGTDSCVYKTDNGYSLKVSAATAIPKLKMEYKILQKLRHPNIIRCFDFINESDYAAILLEPIIAQLGEDHLYEQGLAYCHAHDLLHGDIRLNNLGIDLQGNSKLFDFGNAYSVCSGDQKQHEMTKLIDVLHSPVARERRYIRRRGEVPC